MPRKSRKPRKGHKGAPSRTRKRRKDYSTKRGDKVFHRQGKYVYRHFKPFGGFLYSLIAE